TKDLHFVAQMQIIYCFITFTKNTILCMALLAHEPIEQQTVDKLEIPADLNFDEFSLTQLKKNQA
ncbi:MAG: hypothetical protein ABIO05_07895, partial [Ferruginibacter sp.]